MVFSRLWVCFFCVRECVTQADDNNRCDATNGKWTKQDKMFVMNKVMSYLPLWLVSEKLQVSYIFSTKRAFWMTIYGYVSNRRRWQQPSPPAIPPFSDVGRNNTIACCWRLMERRDSTRSATSNFLSYQLDCWVCPDTQSISTRHSENTMIFRRLHCPMWFEYRWDKIW